MSLKTMVTIATQQKPSIANIAFEAVLAEGATLMSESTDYPVEDGSIFQDHINNQPTTLRMTIAESEISTGGKIQTLDATAVGIASNLVPDSAAAALNAGVILQEAASGSGSAATRCAATWERLSKLHANRAVFPVQLSLKSYANMHITSLSYDRDESNENIVSIQLELKQISTAKTNVQTGSASAPVNTNLPQAAAPKNMGLISRLVEKLQ